MNDIFSLWKVILARHKQHGDTYYITIIREYLIDVPDVLGTQITKQAFAAIRLMSSHVPAVFSCLHYFGVPGG